MGIALAFVIAGLYTWAGSPWSGAAFVGVGLGLLVIHLFVPKSVPLSTTANVMTAVTWVATAVVGLRTGGPESPMVMWNLFPPLTTYVLVGRRAAMRWAVLSGVQIALFYMADRVWGPLADDLSPAASDVHDIVMLIVCVLAFALVITGNESVRVAEQAHVQQANRALERQRILGDMHDGIGSQLMGLMVQVRARRIDEDRLLQGLSSCLDDLKLIVDSLDPEERSFELAVAELRARLEPRFDASGVELRWDVEGAPPELGAEATLQVLRALQEMTSNALRHAQASTVSVRLRWASPVRFEVSVADDGTGFDPDAAARVGRGMASLRSRAHRLGGTLTIAPRARRRPTGRGPS